MSDSGQAPPGWYDDPEHAGQLRYWDGTHWTDDRRPMGSSSGSPAVSHQRVDEQYSGERPNDWLWPSIIANVCCCTPVAVAGVVFAAKSQYAAKAGRMADAHENSRKAKMWTLIAFGVALLWYGGWLTLALVGGGFSGFEDFQQFQQP